MNYISLILVCLVCFSCVSKKTTLTNSSSGSKELKSISHKDYAEPPHIDLINVRWVLKELNGISLNQEALTGDIYIRFVDSTSIEGFGGCNKIFGSYTALNNSLKIGPISSTRMYCIKDDVEYKLIDAMRNVETYSTDSKYLYFVSRGKTTAKFEAIYL